MNDRMRRPRRGRHRWSDHRSGLHAGHRRHQLLRDHHGGGLDRLPRHTSAYAGPQAERESGGRAYRYSTASSTTTAGAITATFAARPARRPVVHREGVHRFHDDRDVLHPDELHVGRTQITGLAAGTSYYVQITAVGPTGYASQATAISAATLATPQISAVGTPTLGNGTSTTSGSLTVTFGAPTTKASGQTYTALACTNAAMNTGCVGPATVTSGAQITGLTAGTGYYVTVTAVASTGWLASTSSVSAIATATEQLNTPGTPTVTASGSNALKVTYAASSNAPGGQLYSVKACTNSGMTSGCVTQTVASGNTITGLANFTSYWVTVTASASTGYLASAATTPATGPTTS